MTHVVSRIVMERIVCGCYDRDGWHGMWIRMDGMSWMKGGNGMVGMVLYVKHKGSG